MVKRILELFSGTGSVGTVFREHGWEVVSLDMLLPADIRMDIMHWDETLSYPVNYFDVVWASPPCTEYSAAKTVGVRKINEANAIVQRTLDIIDYFKPIFYIMENPQTGLLKQQHMVQGLPYNDVDYCKYGMPYRKRTRLWNNVTLWDPRLLCKRDCDSMDASGRRHREVAQQGVSAGYVPCRHSLRELYRVPSALIEELHDAIVATCPELS